MSFKDLLEPEGDLYNLKHLKHNGENVVYWYISGGTYYDVNPPRKAKDMKCPDCGGTTGYTWMEKVEKYSWFCAEDKCLEKALNKNN